MAQTNASKSSENREMYTRPNCVCSLIAIGFDILHHIEGQVLPVPWEGEWHLRKCFPCILSRKHLVGHTSVIVVHGRLGHAWKTLTSVGID